MNKYKELVKLGDMKPQFKVLIPYALAIIDRTNAMNIFSRAIQPIHHQIGILYGYRNALINTKLFFAQILASMLMTLIIVSTFAILSKDIILLYYGLFILAFLPFVFIKSISKQVTKRANEIKIELPEFLNKVTLLVNAGETIQQAIVRSMPTTQIAIKSYLYKELLIAVQQIKNNETLPVVLEELSNRCGVQEVSVFTTTVILNYRRGGDEFVTALKSLSYELWLRRKTLARTLGEQASSKLVFPMVFIFLIVMVIIAAPALMMF